MYETANSKIRLGFNRFYVTKRSTLRTFEIQVNNVASLFTSISIFGLSDLLQILCKPVPSVSFAVLCIIVWKYNKLLDGLIAK